MNGYYTREVKRVPTNDISTYIDKFSGRVYEVKETQSSTRKYWHIRQVIGGRASAWKRTAKKEIDFILSNCEKKAKPYYCLFVADLIGFWSYEFGSYDKGDVLDEREAFRDSGTKLKDIKVITLPEDNQEAIDKKQAELNA